MELEGKIALVTGAGSGIGAAAALRLAREGATMMLVSRTESELAEVRDAIEEAGGTAGFRALDTADDHAMQSLFATIGEQYGRLDIAFANAGVNGVWAPIDRLTPEEWDETIRINLRGTFLTLHHAVPLMKESGGAILITASINGTRTFTTAGASAYATTKAGQLALGQMAALELARYRIRVNVICPGAIGTEISDNTDKRDTEDAKVPAQYPDGTVPLTRGKPGTAEQVADLVAFLASDRASHISGTPVWIDGAQSLLV
ncbi:MAG TPA: SDR family NAD(P)-dependent oxidoreductase [Devosiaceae bacterium]|jgi:NAD(P)-dependent dehydrogenase (short-subunit alcohol dehydrogenase family)